MFSKNEKGQTLVVVVLMVAVIFLVGAAAIELGLSVKKNAISEVAQQKAYYIAEAGVELALADLRQRALTSDQVLDDFSISNKPYADGQIDSVTVSATATEGEIGDLVTITSVGRYMKAKKTLKVTVLVTRMADVFHGLSVLPETAVDVSALGKFIITTSEGQTKRPWVIVNGSIDFGSSAGEVNADVFASGAIIDTHNVVKGVKRSYYTPIPSFPDLPSDSWFFANAKLCFAGDTTIGMPDTKGRQQQGNFLDITTLVANGIYFVDGNVTIAGTYSVPATIVATGNIEVGDLRRADRNNGLLLTLMARGDVVIKGSNDIDAVIVAGSSYGADGSKTVVGSIVTRNIDNKLAGMTTVITDLVLVEQSLQWFFQKLRDTAYPILTIKSWQGG